MRADDWMVDFLIKKGTTDVFGIPGVVVMDFLYAVERRKGEICPHLCFHEQGGAYAACGYAQIKGQLGVAYATRGPGFTNMITAIADAYCDSIPVLFITAHASEDKEESIRVLTNQEIDTVAMVKNITKLSVRIDDVGSLQEVFSKACDVALSGRKGPVFLDIFNGLFKCEVSEYNEKCESELNFSFQTDRFLNDLKGLISESERPVFLLGNSVRNAHCVTEIQNISARYKIPILSSRVGQDIMPQFNGYFGYIGSRAQRYSNFILSKADLIISLGNRLAFPVKSKSFEQITANAKIVRVDIDANEFIRNIPNSFCFQADVNEAVSIMARENLPFNNMDDWYAVCTLLRDRLKGCDDYAPIEIIKEIMSFAGEDTIFACDVGNHSFWVTSAYSRTITNNRIIYSGSFGALGSSLPKAIGAFYATNRPVICFAGDQGIQLNIQELQFLSLNKIPVTIVILNNQSSGMIKDREEERYGKHCLHTTLNDGYGFPNFSLLAETYNLAYMKCEGGLGNAELIRNVVGRAGIIEIIIDSDMKSYPMLPVGKPCQDMYPEIPRETYKELDEM